MKTKTAALLAGLLVLCLVGVVAATYLMTSPESDDVTVSTQATLSKVTVSTISVTVGDSLTLSTTVSDHTSGLTVTFFNNNDVSVGTATTDSSGTASLTLQPPEGVWSFYATATHP